LLRFSKAVYIDAWPNRGTAKEKDPAETATRPHATDVEEEQKIRKLARSRHAPGDWIARACIVFFSWESLSIAKIAEKLGCYPQTVRRRLHRFNTEGIDGLGQV
jgi:DNA-directed RNA polymerase specialized sigma24 family protein